MVSGRVVKTRISHSSPLVSLVVKDISAPSDRPIQFLCAVFVVSDQSMWSRFSSSLGA
jgi:hypothetical protein